MTFSRLLLFIFFSALCALGSLNAETRTNTGFGASYTYTITRNSPAGTVAVQYLSGSPPAFGGHWFKVYNASGTLTYNGDPGTGKVTSPVGGWIWVAIWQSVNTNTAGTFTVYSSSEPQTITISPQTVTVNEGDSVNFTVSGGHNAYVYEAPDGGFGSPPSLLFGGATFGEFETGETKTFRIQVYNVEGNGYSRSDTVTGTVIVQRSKKVRKILDANTTPYNIIWNATQNGVSIGTHTQAPGAAAYTWTIITNSNAPVTFDMTLVGVKKDGESLIDDPSSHVTTQVPGSVTPTTNPTPSKIDGATDTSGVKKPGARIPQIWSPNSNTTDQVIREATEKILDEMKGTPPESRLFPESVEGAELNMPEASELVGSLSDMLPAVPTLPASIGQNPVWSLVIPCPYIGQLDFSMDLGQWPSAMAAFRAMLLACECVVFFFVTVSIIKGAFAS